MCLSLFSTATSAGLLGAEMAGVAPGVVDGVGAAPKLGARDFDVSVPPTTLNTNTVLAEGKVYDIVAGSVPIFSSKGGPRSIGTGGDPTVPHHGILQSMVFSLKTEGLNLVTHFLAEREE